MEIEETPRGWIVVVAAMIGLSVGMSPVPFYTIGMLAPELSKAFGWSFGAIMTSIALQSVVNIVAVPIAGIAVDRFGARPVALGSLLLFGICYMSLALTPGSLLIFYLQWGLMTAAGAGTLNGTWNRVVAGWFDRHLGLAIGITSAGTGFTGFLLKPFCAWLILNHGWRATFLIIGLLPMVIGMPVVAWFLREHGAARATMDGTAARRNEPGLTLRESARSRQFWLLGLAFLFIAFSLTAPTPNLENILRFHSFDLPTIAQITSVFGLSVITGRILCGGLIDRVWAPAFACVFFSLPAAACWLLARPHIDEPEAITAVIALGLAAGFEFDLLGYLVARYFGRRHYGAIFAFFYVLVSFAGGLGPGAFGRAFDVTGSYAGVLLVAAACILASGLLLLLMGPYPSWQRRPQSGS